MSPREFQQFQNRSVEVETQREQGDSADDVLSGNKMALIETTAIAFHKDISWDKFLEELKTIDFDIFFRGALISSNISVTEIGSKCFLVDFDEVEKLGRCCTPITKRIMSFVISKPLLPSSSVIYKDMIFYRQNPRGSYYYKYYSNKVHELIESLVLKMVLELIQSLIHKMEKKTNEDNILAAAPKSQ